MRSCFLLSLCFAITTAMPASNPKAQRAFKDGLRYETIAQWKEADKAYSEAIQNDPADAASYQHRAKVRYELGDYQHALEDADLFLRTQPTSAEGYQLRGDIHRRLTDHRHALADYTRAIEAG
ncbi:MAG: Tetratricopeptide repeat, partial [Acidobacteriaceae bacterium]